jgi:uncharacterized protein (TIGR02246 family)
MTTRSPTETVQAQLDAYNAQDLDRFCTLYAPDCVIADLNGAVQQSGIAEIRARYEKAWAQFPQNRAVALSRIVVGNTVIDHERVSRAPDGETFEVAAIYTMRDGLIARVDFAR